MLLGLPLAGPAIGPLDAPPGWEASMAQRFEGVFDGAPVLASEPHGPKYEWLQRFSVSSSATYLSFVVFLVLQLNLLFINTFSLLNTDPEFPGVSKCPSECDTDHS